MRIGRMEDGARLARTARLTRTRPLTQEGSRAMIRPLPAGTTRSPNAIGESPGPHGPDATSAVLRKRGDNRGQTKHMTADAALSMVPDRGSEIDDEGRLHAWATSPSFVCP